MKIYALFFLLIALISFAPLRAQSPQAWQDGDKPIAETDHMKSKAGFGAILFLTDREKFFDDWNKPEPPNISPLQKARRNVPIFTTILFVDPATDAMQRAKITCYVIVHKPDGTVYGEEELIGWDGKNTFPPHMLQLAQDRMGILIEPKDQAGIYTVEATVRDEVKKVELQLKSSFQVPE